jgi:IS605 OrfB family transposase
MAQETGVGSTQRAYTLRLRPAITRTDSPADIRRKAREMQDALWATHEAVNRGAKAFGDWLLTLRGGLDHRLADHPTADERRNRRILLALSWLSVEDEYGAPVNANAIVAYGEGCSRQTDNQDARNRKVTEVLREILRTRGVPEKEIGQPEASGTWIGDCNDSLCAAIRDDAVWVNRSLVFDEHSKCFKGLDRGYAAQQVLSFFGPTADDYFALPSDAEDGSLAASQSEGPDFRTAARQWVSTNFGTGKKTDISQIITALTTLSSCGLDQFSGRSKVDLLRHFANVLKCQPGNDLEKTVRAAVGWITGRPSKGRIAIQNLPDVLTPECLRVLKTKLDEEAAEKSAEAKVPPWIASFRQQMGDEIGTPFVLHRDLTGEYSVMLDHAARRVSIAHSWVKRAEAEKRRFANNAEKIESVPPKAREWLDQASQARSGSTGSAGEYRIRPRAIEGWDAVVRRWSQSDCKTEEDRIMAVRQIQSDWDEDKKFGDAQLFEALAAEDAICVWQSDGKPDPQPLKAYVSAMDARDRQLRFKVPAYRHPDPLRHPVFCDFGKSRWDVKFAIHEREKAKGSRRKVPREDAEWHNDRRGIRMTLWTAHNMVKLPMRWACKRLANDLAIDSEPTEDATEVTRADRLGRAAAGATRAATVANVFEEKDWNSRLQAPRSQLDRIAALKTKGKTEQAKALRQRLRWFASFSPRLRPLGPFISFASSNGISPNAKGQYYPHAETNKAGNRKGQAKLVLSRLPGLRVLSVDLGHRFAAACAVWEALSEEDFKREIAGRTAKLGGPGESDLYFHTCHKDDQGKERVTVYRRIGPDRLNGNPHPAPWARLDRQFLIKLQGEGRPARMASQAELAAVREMEESLGRVRDASEPLPRRVDELMSHAVRIARLALKRHGDRARIAFAMTADYKPMPGAQKYYFCPDHPPDTFQDTAEERKQKYIEFIQDALLLWHDLFSSRGWKDEKAETLWKETIAKLAGYQTPEPVPEDFPGAQRKKRREENRHRLRPAAETLANDKKLRDELHALWKQRWKADDGDNTNRRKLREATGWYARLRRLQNWVMPSAAAKRIDIRNVGGLSLMRLATLTELRRKVQVGFLTRLRPDGQREQLREKFGQRALDALEKMREQRVKQLASRIVEAALGIGRIKSAPGRDRKRPRQAVDKPCHAIVIESLRNYRPEELRTRRENRALMNWSSGKVRKYLEEGCQLHGLHLREVSPNYTSRQCSRTGLPGLRCEDVPVDEFLNSPWWNKAVNAAKRKIENGSTDAESRLLVDLYEKWRSTPESEWKHEAKRKLMKTVRVQRSGGSLFVAAPPSECRKNGHNPCALCNAERGIQADLNAAANIGLRALLDPDFSAKWWYVPCSSKDGRPAADKVSGAACLDLNWKLLEISERRGANRDYANAWRDLSGCDLSEHGWSDAPRYWNGVRFRVIRALRGLNGLQTDTSAATDEIV